METVKCSQEQAMASWVNSLNQIRLDNLLEDLFDADLNFEEALIELDKIREFISTPEHILGSAKSKHGEIAEHLQVRISNARNLIQGLKAEYTFDGVGRTAPEDYLKNGVAVQSKFYVGTTGKQSFNAIKQHLEKYPDFINNGGVYDIPKEQHEQLIKTMNLKSPKLNSKEYNLKKAIEEFEKLHDVKFNDVINPSAVNYKDAQLGAVDKTINKEESALNREYDEQRAEAYQASKPTWQEANKVAGIGSALEGGVAFASSVYQKKKDGKSLSEFTANDWKDVGVDTSVGAVKGGIRGYAIYGMTNFTATPAAVATAFTTACFGMTSLAVKLNGGKISSQEFIEQSEVLCLEVSVSAVSSVLGQAIIPIPILGALIGNTAGMMMYGVAQSNLSKNEQMLIKKHVNDMDLLNRVLDEKYHILVELLKAEFEKFNTLVEFAFSEKVDEAFTGSIQLCKFVGVKQDKILNNKKDIDTYFGHKEK